MKPTLRTAAIAACALASAALLSSEAGARARVHIYTSNPYYAVTGLSWYAVRAYYADGPWSGPGFGYTGWSDYAAQNGIGCTPGTLIKGGDGIMYLCQ